MLILHDSDVDAILYWLDDLIVGYENLSEEVTPDELDELKEFVGRLRGAAELNRGKEF